MTKSVIDFLLPGKENGISMPELARAMGTTERAIRREIANARIRGEPILAGVNGYFIADGAAEIQEYVLSRQKAIKTISMELAPMRRRLKELEQQT